MPNIVGKSKLKVDDRFHITALGFNSNNQGNPTTFFGQDGPIDTVVGGNTVDVNFDEVLPKSSKPPFDWWALNDREGGYAITLIGGVTKWDFGGCKTVGVGKAVDYTAGTTRRSIRIRAKTEIER